MKSLKIGFVLDDTLDTTDGVQQYVLTLGKWLSEKGHEVHYLVGQTARRDIKNVHSLSKNMQVTFNGNRMSMPLPASSAKIASLLNAQMYDVLHVQIPYSPFMAHKLILHAPMDTKIVGTFHIAPHSYVVSATARLLGVWSHRSLKRFDTLLSVSSAAADFAKKTFKIKTVILPNVVETRKYATAKPFRKSQPVQTIVFLGRLVPRKGCMVLLEALKILGGSYSLQNVKLIICGRGPLEKVLKDFVIHNDLMSVVEFTGFVSEEAKARYLKSADIAVFPSTGGESFGIVLLEAMAADNPVVLGADNAGYRTVLSTHGDSLFPVNDAVSLAHKLQIFLTSKVEREKTVSLQRAYIQQFDVEVVGKKLLKIYESSSS